MVVGGVVTVRIVETASTVTGGGGSSRSNTDSDFVVITSGAEPTERNWLTSSSRRRADHGTSESGGWGWVLCFIRVVGVTE